jgi:hypothetical protein
VVTTRKNVVTTRKDFVTSGKAIAEVERMV